MLDNTLVTAQAVADYFGVTVATVNRWVRQERIPFIRPTRRIVRFRLADVERSFAQPTQQHCDREETLISADRDSEVAK